MTEPRDQEQNPTAPPPPEPVDEASALIPAVLAAYAAYRLWRGSHDSVPTGWQQLATVLKLRRLLSTSLEMLAQRAATEQRGAAGRTGDELWTGANAAVQAGVEAGVQTVAEGLLWTDKNTPGGRDPATRESADEGHPGPYMPGPGDPPTLLAQMTASSVINTTTAAAGAAAGWTKKQWRSQRDPRVRATHAALDGTTVAEKDSFISPSGAKLRWPGDPRAPMAERAGCRCRLVMSRR